MRAPYQVLVLPFRCLSNGQVEFAALRRADDGNWQAVAGGGNLGELPMHAAKREAQEELGLGQNARYFALQALASIPRIAFSAHIQWSRDLYVIPEYAFAVDWRDSTVRLSQERTRLTWGTYEQNYELFSWQSNKVALWELAERLRRGELPAQIVFA
jgi:dihydroneopterin triphosphate diphosphatase